MEGCTEACYLSVGAVVPYLVGCRAVAVERERRLSAATAGAVVETRQCGRAGEGEAPASFPRETVSAYPYPLIRRPSQNP